MRKLYHEIRDPLHVFIRLDSDERRVLDSAPFQRLRHIHQLALTYLVYPGATHRRFEHSLGVMELAEKVYGVVTEPSNLHRDTRETIESEIGNCDRKRYWRRVLRMAALCHDIGHLPFSHASEDLLPEGWSDERLTADLIRSDEMKDIWDSMVPPLKPEHIVKVAIGQRKLSEFDDAVSFSVWESLLSEIVVGDEFGVDRMDYLLRDSYHAGVAYGKFDHFRLIDTIRFLPKGEGESTEPTLGVEEGGIQSTVALLLARHYMFTQLYHHPVRVSYDLHLMDFLKEYLPNGKFSVDISEHLKLADEDIISAMRSAARDSSAPGHISASIFAKRGHFRLLYEPNANDLVSNPKCGDLVFKAAVREFGEESVRHHLRVQKATTPLFPVLERDGRIVLGASKVELLAKIPPGRVEFVFVRPDLREQAEKWLKDNLKSISALKEEKTHG